MSDESEWVPLTPNTTRRNGAFGPQTNLEMCIRDVRGEFCPMCEIWGYKRIFRIFLSLQTVARCKYEVISNYEETLGRFLNGNLPRSNCWLSRGIIDVWAWPFVINKSQHQSTLLWVDSSTRKLYFGSKKKMPRLVSWSFFRRMSRLQLRKARTQKE